MALNMRLCLLLASPHSRRSSVTRPERCAHPHRRESGLTIIELELELELKDSSHPVYDSLPYRCRK